MPATIKLPRMWSGTTTNGEIEFEVSGANLREALRDLCEKQPSLTDRLFDGGGRVPRFLSVFVDGEDVRPLAGLDTVLTDGTRIDVKTPIAGG